MSPPRQFVYLVLRDMSRRAEYSLRSIGTSRFFHPTKPPQPSGVHHRPPTEVSNLPSPALGFCPPHSTPCGGEMDFMLLGRDKVLGTDQMGRALLYDPHRHNVRTMPSFTSPKNMPISLTLGEDNLYVMNTIPNWPEGKSCGSHNHSLDALVFQQDRKDNEDWFCRSLGPVPVTQHEESEAHCFYNYGNIRSYTVAGGGSSIWVSKLGMGTYSYDTVSELWTKAGDWMLPFKGLATHVPEHGLWFGLASSSSDDCDNYDNDLDLLCAMDLRVQQPPVVCGAWEHVTPPAHWEWLPHTSYLLHLGSSKFCIARFFVCQTAVSRLLAVFTGVEVERCGDDQAGQLQMVMHKSEVYMLPYTAMYWVL